MINGSSELQEAYDTGFKYGLQEADIQIRGLKKRLKLAIANLKAADLSCEFCLHAGNQPPDCDGECDRCQKNCACAGCQNNSSWRWSGAKARL